MNCHLASLAEVCRVNCAHALECKLHVVPESTRSVTPRVRAHIPEYAVVQLWCSDYVPVKKQAEAPAKAVAPGAPKKGA